MKGRGYTGKSDKKAAKYIVDIFAKLGLQPVYNGSYYQYFPITVNTFPGNMKVEVNDSLLLPGVDYHVQSYTPSIKGDFFLVEVSREEMKTKEKLINAVKKAENSFLIVDTAGKSSENMVEKQRIDEFINLLSFSKNIPLSGLIVETGEKLTWGPAGFVAPRPVIHTVVDLHPGAIKLNIKNKFLENYTTSNVAGLIPGNEVPNSFLVLTAHYDHLGSMVMKYIFPGQMTMPVVLQYFYLLPNIFLKIPLDNLYYSWPLEQKKLVYLVQRHLFLTR